MSRMALVAVGLTTLVGVGPAPLDAQTTAYLATNEAPRPSIEMGTTEARALLDTYCVACHNERTRTADLALDSTDLSAVGQDAALWEHVIRRLRANAMPPVGRPRPDAARSRAFIAWLETQLDTRRGWTKIRAGRRFIDSIGSSMATPSGTCLVWRWMCARYSRPTMNITGLTTLPRCCRCHRH